MRKFIPLSVFNQLYSSQSDLLTPEGMNAFRGRLTEEGIRVAAEAGFNTEEFIAFQETLNDPSSIVFYGWIEQDKAVKNALLGQKFSLFVDAAKHLKHSLSDGYQKFLSPVLSIRLLYAEINSDAERKIAFSFVSLLDERHRALVEDRLFQPYQERLEELKTILENATDEQELVNSVTPLCSDDVIASVNYLSRASYASKLGYIDRILNTIHSKACTVRFANWVLERMSHVELNNEHKYKLTDLRKDLRQGNLTVKNHKKGETPIRWGSVFAMIAVVLIVGVVIFLIAYKPFNEVKKPVFSNNSSFREFTKEERMRMDSLLKVMDNPFDKTEEIDPMNVPTQMGVDVDLVLRKSFKNERMESIYDDLMADVVLKETYPNTDCPDSKNASSKPSNALKSLSNMTGVHSAVLRNESEYDVLVYVAEISKTGNVFVSLIKPNETIEFKINKFSTLMIVAGNAYQAFNAPQNSIDEEQPSDAFTHHFCDTDLNYEETINTSYQFLHPREGKNKLMVMGAKSGYVHLVDVHGVLETY